MPHNHAPLDTLEGFEAVGAESLLRFPLGSCSVGVRCEYVTHFYFLPDGGKRDEAARSTGRRACSRAPCGF